MNRGSKAVGIKQECLSEVYERRVRKKARAIMNDDSHILAALYQMLPSGRRLRAFPGKKVRTRKSFIPVSISLLNKQ